MGSGLVLRRIYGPTLLQPEHPVVPPRSWTKCLIHVSTSYISMHATLLLVSQRHAREPAISRCGICSPYAVCFFSFLWTGLPACLTAGFRRLPATASFPLAQTWRGLAKAGLVAMVIAYPDPQIRHYCAAWQATAGWEHAIARLLILRGLIV